MVDPRSPWYDQRATQSPLSGAPVANRLPEPHRKNAAMFADPQSITVVGSTATSLPRTGAGLEQGVFTSADGTVQLSVSHSSKKRHRRSARINLSKVISDPLIPNQNTKVSYSAYVVLDVPVNGVSAAESVKALTGLAAWLTEANATKFVGGEI